MSFLWAFELGSGSDSLGFCIDALVVGLPFQILLICLYAATGGAVQGASIIFECHNVEQPIYSLDPPPPKHPNFARECRSSLFGFETSRSLVVGRTVREGNATKTVSQGYSLGNNGQPRNVLHLDWIAQLVLLAYLITMEHRTGITLGNYIFRMEVVSWKSPGSPGIPLINAIVRQLGAMAWVGSGNSLGIYEYTAGGQFRSITRESMASDGFALIMASVVVVLWYLCNLHPDCY